MAREIIAWSAATRHGAAYFLTVETHVLIGARQQYFHIVAADLFVAPRRSLQPGAGHGRLPPPINYTLNPSQSPEPEMRHSRALSLRNRYAN